MKKRLRIFRVMMSLILLYILFHLSVITLFDPYGLEAKIKRRHTIAKELKYYHRGDIYDRSGNLLATTKYNYQLDLDKTYIHSKAPDSTAEKKLYELYAETLGRITRRDVSLLKTHLQQNQYVSTCLSSNLLLSEINDIISEVKKKVNADSSYGISDWQASEALLFTRISEKRVYPYHDLAPRLLGLAAANANEIKSPDEGSGSLNLFQHLKGLCGIEKTFEDLLTGENGWQEIIYDANNNKVLKPALQSRKPTHGDDIYLTINIRFQEILEEKLHEGLNKYGARNAMGVIMNVHTGEILALAGEHEKDQNLETATLRTYSNLPVSYSLEPGSTLKPITALLALENNIYKPDELIDCSPLKFEYATKTRIIRDHDDYNKLNLEDVIVKSSNPGISRVAMKLGKEKLYNRLIDMGLGRETLSGIYGESKGIFRHLDDWTEYSLSSIAFGQEISLNMLHLAVIFAAFANQGKILQPQILYYSQDQYGDKANQLKPKVFRTISQPHYIKQINQYLHNAVQRGTATETKLNFITISGKTGTSEIITLGNDGEVETRHNSLFAGFLPSNDPQLVIVIAFDRCVEDENKYYFASQSAVPTFREIVKKILVLPECNLLSSNSITNDQIAILPNLVGMKKNQAVNTLKQFGLDYSFVNNQSDGIISDHYPPANIRFNRNQQVKLALAKPGQKITDKKLMPDFEGMTLREAYELARERLIEITATGNGIVYQQNIPPKTEISLEDRCHIYLN